MTFLRVRGGTKKYVMDENVTHIVGITFLGFCVVYFEQTNTFVHTIIRDIYFFGTYVRVFGVKCGYLQREDREMEQIYDN